MKLLINSIFLVFLLIATPCFATLQGDTVWEIRGGAGNDDNGGCYDEGQGGTSEDFSQQNGAQLTLTDLATGGIGSTTLTSVTGGFDENGQDDGNIVGNCIQIKSGTNLGSVFFFEITAYTDDNTVTIDKAADDGVGGLASGTGSVGGALNTISKAVDNVESGGNTVWIKAATYTEMVTITDSGITSRRFSIRGYNSSRNDSPIGANRPVIDAEDTRDHAITVPGNNDNYLFDSLILEDGLNDGFEGNSLSTNNMFRNILSRNNNAWGIDARDGDHLFVEASGNTSGGIVQGSLILFCYLHDNASGPGSDSNGAGGSIISSVADSNGGDGFETGHSTLWLNSVAYNNTGATSEGFSFNDNTSGGRNNAFNCISEDNGNHGFAVTGGGGVYFIENVSTNGNVDTAISGFRSDMQKNNITGAVNFTDNTGGDFTLQSGSPALDAGIAIDTYTGITGNYKWNIGADQDDVTAAGGGGSSLSVSTNF